MIASSVIARQRQIRRFVVAWMGITLLMGALTFAGIYYATGLAGAEADDVAALPNAEIESLVQSDGAGTGGEPVGAAQQATAIPTLTPPPTALGDYQVGIQVQSNLEPETYRIWMNEVRDKLKLNWIKQQVRWEVVEPQPGQYDWSELDVSLPMAQEYGTKVMLSIVTAPEWAREPGNQRLDEVGPPADPQTFANFITTLLYRYPGQVHAIEVWNEMNIDREWASIYGLSPERYVQMLSVVYQAIKAVDPDIIVISGALSPAATWSDGSALDDFTYMDQMIQAGLLTTTDCVGAHHNGYNIGPNVPWNSVPNDPSATFRGPFDNPHHSWSFYSTINGYAQSIQQAGSDKKLCITEFGWPTTEDLGGFPIGFEFANDNTLAEQAAFLDEAIRLMDEWGFVWLAFVWNLNYGPQAGWDATNDNVPYSLLRPDWAPAPAYEAIGAYSFRQQ